MKTPKLVKDYSRLSEANLDFKAQMIIVNLTDNPHFPITTPSLANFSVIKSEYSAALQNSAEGAKTAIAIKNQAKATLLQNMRFLAANVESIAQGDRAMLVSSGFELATEGDNIPPLGAPTNFSISDGANAGELRLTVKGVPNAVSYLHEYTEGPITEESIWVSKITTSRTHTFTGIRSGLRVFCRVAAVGRKGQEVYGNVLSRVVQ